MEHQCHFLCGGVIRDIVVIAVLAATYVIHCLICIGGTCGAFSLVEGLLGLVEGICGEVRVILCVLLVSDYKPLREGTVNDILMEHTAEAVTSGVVEIGREQERECQLAAVLYGLVDAVVGRGTILVKKLSKLHLQM